MAHATTKQEDEFLTLQEVAARLKVSKDTVRRLFRDDESVIAINGSGPRNSVNGRVRLRIPASSVERKISELKRIR